MNCPIYCDADFPTRPEAIDGRRGRTLPIMNGMILFTRIIEKSDGHQPAVAATCLVFPNRKATAPAAKGNFRAAAQ